jgi:hypothetical protein
MDNELLNYLTTDSGHARISPEKLELMGKAASNMYLDTGLSLNEAVVKLASEHPNINSDQLKRIVEFANQSTYLALHDRAKTAGAGSSYPQFPLADIGRVVQDMSDGARPTVVTQTDLDYSRQPEKSKTASANLKTASARVEEALAEMFGANREKTAADLDYTSNTVFEEVYSARDSLIGLKEHLQHVGEQFDLMQKEASEEFYDLTKRHLLAKGDFVDVMVAARSSGASHEKIAQVMKPVIERLVKEKVASSRQLIENSKQIEKVAHRVVNEQHPLVRSFREVLTANNEIDTISTGLEQVEGELSKVSSFLKENFGGQSSR